MLWEAVLLPLWQQVGQVLPAGAAVWLALSLLTCCVLLLAERVRGRPLQTAWPVLAIATSLVYVTYRTTTSGVSWPERVAFAVLLAAETFSLLRFIVSQLTFATAPRAPEERARLPHEPPSWPTVDVLVPTYNEPREVLEPTLTGCLSQDYPAHLFRVHVLDDGRRGWLREWCRERDVNYLTRTDRRHGKAGNLNHGLAHTRGQVVVVFDADMVPLPHALRTLVAPLTVDPQVAFVQAPQVFYNQDPFQYNLRAPHWPNEQDYFMQVIQPRRAQHNAVLCIGTNVAYRRAALEDIGGIPTYSITEDTATSLALHARGWKGVYVSTVVARGLAPESWTEMMGQRDRWCRGSLQVLRKQCPLTTRGLTPMQRLIYLEGLLYWFFGLEKLVYIAAPLAFLLFDLRSVAAPALTFVAFWLPHQLVSVLLFPRVSGGKRTFWQSHVYELAMSPFLAWSTLRGLFGGAARFRVTAKGRQVAARRSPVAVLWLALLLLTTVALYRGVFTSAVPFDWVVLSAGWATYNAVGMFYALRASLDRPRLRAYERFPVDLPVRVEFRGYTLAGRLKNVSLGGALLKLEGAVEVAPEEELGVRLQHHTLRARVVRQEGAGLFGVVWTELTPDLYRAVWELSYGRLPEPSAT